MTKPVGMVASLVAGLLLTASARADDVVAAAKRGDLFAVKHYLAKSPDALAARDRFRYTPLHWAAVQGHWDVVATLVERGADVNALGGDGGTPLHMACHHDRPDMVRLLLDAGADLTIRNRWGRTPLHVAARRDCDLVAALLLARGADPNAVTKEGWTPLHVAFMAGHPRVREILLGHGADPGQEDDTGKIPADYAFTRPAAVEDEETDLGAYVGRYALGPDVVLRVWLDDGRLHMAEFGPNELYPTGPDTFYCRREPWQVTFHRDDGGAVDRVDVAFLRRTVHGTRLPEYRYVGSRVCAECHLSEASGAQSIHWMQSAHARSYWMLKTDWARHLISIRDEYHGVEEPTNDGRCLKCHTTGAQDPDFEPAASFRPEKGVGCEACHGPGSAYIDPAIMADHEAFLSHGGRVPDEATCRQCHQGDGFRYEERLREIAHPRPAETSDPS
ncbi:MAG: ankyrin repeat domain-containing protein [Acidobacteria bacterium]|nr:ankyrin repeat domain-containing protein [Acidobacteriota bacterium]